MDQLNFTRPCPQCGTVIYYKRKKDRNSAEKKKIICKECSKKNRVAQGNYNPKEEFVCFCCGKTFREWRSQLTNPETPYCSKLCWQNNGTKSLIGHRFGKLLVVGRDRKNQTTFYECKCDCGNTSTVTHTNLMNGTQSCGCLILERRGGERKPLNEVIERSIWNYYKRNAKTRNYEWQLDYNDFVKLINGNCYYCGSEKSTLHTWRYKHETASLPFNGVDRLNNSIGYTLYNSVSCCKTCNFAKNDMSFKEFKSWAARLFNNLKKWK